MTPSFDYLAYFTELNKQIDRQAEALGEFAGLGFADLAFAV